MKKKLLIINKSFELGGIQTALANTVAAISDTYEVTLAIFNSHGPLRETVPANVQLLKMPPLTETLGMTFADCKEYGTFLQKSFKIIGTLWAKLFGNDLPIAFALAFQKHIGEYDTVISYHHEVDDETLVAGFGKFALEKCTAKNRIGWIHADFIATNLATKKNLKIYEKFDKIVAVSKTAMDSFVTAYPSLKSKCDYCYNPVPANEIIAKSNQENNVFHTSVEDVVLFSASRLVEEKGLVPALENLLPIFEKYRNLKWFIAGVGPEENTLKRIIEGKHLTDRVVLLGFKQNPYPYIKEADYLFLPSLHETFGMVAGEANVLGTPVVASDIPIMREVLKECDYLCKDHNYAPVIESLIKKGKSEFQSESRPEDDWNAQFERILEC